MPIKRVKADPRVKANVGRVALQRGPIVYCVEAVDNGGRALNLALPPDAELTTEHRGRPARRRHRHQGQGAGAAEGERAAEVGRVHRDPVLRLGQPRRRRDGRLAAGGRFAWRKRRRRRRSRTRAGRPHRTRASATRYEALSDGTDIADSGQVAMPRFTWWPRKGYDRVGAVRLPAGRRRCRASRSTGSTTNGTAAGAACRRRGNFSIVKPTRGSRSRSIGEPPGVKKDKFNTLTFKPVAADALRLEAKLRDGYSAGILEWRVK